MLVCGSLQGFDRPWSLGKGVSRTQPAYPAYRTRVTQGVECMSVWARAKDVTGRPCPRWAHRRAMRDALGEALPKGPFLPSSRLRQSTPTVGLEFSDITLRPAAYMWADR